MIRVVCHTNLDLANESWPRELPAVPRIGDYIVSAVEHKSAANPIGFRLTLEVIRVTWEPSRDPENPRFSEWTPHIELHRTGFQRMLPAKPGTGETGSIVAFYQWYAPLVGRNVSAFI